MKRTIQFGKAAKRILSKRVSWVWCDPKKASRARIVEGKLTVDWNSQHYDKRTNKMKFNVTKAIYRKALDSNVNRSL